MSSDAATGGAEVWDRMLKGGDRAVALVNQRTGAAPISVAYVVAEGGGGVAMDVWSGETLGKVKSGGALTITGVCAHCSRLVRISSTLQET